MMYAERIGIFMYIYGGKRPPIIQSIILPQVYETHSSAHILTDRHINRQQSTPYHWFDYSKPLAKYQSHHRMIHPPPAPHSRVILQHRLQVSRKFGKSQEGRPSPPQKMKQIAPSAGVKPKRTKVGRQS